MDTDRNVGREAGRDTGRGVGRDAGRDGALGQYLRQPGFSRLWPKVKEKLERIDRIGGRVTLATLRPQEREALQGLLSINLHGETSVGVELKRLDEALRRTRFDVSLEDCLRVLYPGELVSRRRRREAESAAWDTFCAWAGTPFSAKPLSAAPLTAWWQALAEGDGPGYRAFRECWQEFLQHGDSPGWEAAIAALEALLKRQDGRHGDVRLPVFAAKTTGDAHGLDRSGLAGRMFFWGLVALREMEAGPDGVRAESAETEKGRDAGLADNGLADNATSAPGAFGPELDSDAARALYARFGLALDDISSIVWVAGFPEVAEHPVALTLWTTERLTLRHAPVQLFVVENPSIFGTILDAARGRPLPHPLVCTSGQPSLAALRLFDHAVAVGGTLHYSGDLDAAGLQMAAALANRYGSACVPWRMDWQDYDGMQQRNLPPLREADVMRLEGFHLPWERGRAQEETLAHHMRLRGVKVFQEHMAERLCEDYWEF